MDLFHSFLKAALIRLKLNLQTALECGIEYFEQICGIRMIFKKETLCNSLFFFLVFSLSLL